MARPERGSRKEGVRSRWARWKKSPPVEGLDPEEARERDAKAGRNREPEPLGRVVRGILAGGEMQRGLALGRLMRRWDEVVGKDLAGHCAPAALDPRGLLVAVESSAWATQVSFLAPQIARQANAVLGREAVASVRSTVDPDAAAAARRSRERAPREASKPPGTAEPR